MADRIHKLPWGKSLPVWLSQPRVVVTERLKATGLPLLEQVSVVVCSVSSSLYSPGGVRGTGARSEFSDHTTERNRCVLIVDFIQ